MRRIAFFGRNRGSRHFTSVLLTLAAGITHFERI